MTSVLGYIADYLSPEDNELAILKYLGVASNGLKFMQDLCVCGCVGVCVGVGVGVCASVCVGVGVLALKKEYRNLHLIIGYIHRTQPLHLI